MYAIYIYHSYTHTDIHIYMEKQTLYAIIYSNIHTIFIRIIIIIIIIIIILLLLITIMHLLCRII